MGHHPSRMPPLRVLAGYVSVALIWGSTWAAIKIGVNDVPPFVFAFARAVAVAAALTMVAVALRQPFPRGRRTMAVAMIVGLINIGWSWAIIFWSEQFVPSGLVAVFGAAAPIWTAVLAHFMVKGDRLSALKIIGLVLAAVGLWLLPRKRRQAKAQFRARTEELRSRLLTAMGDEFQRELERSTQRIRDALAPYNRFIRSERDRTQRLLGDLQGSLAELARLRDRIETIADGA